MTVRAVQAVKAVRAVRIARAARTILGQHGNQQKRDSPYQALTTPYVQDLS